ncbi:hypothetical protein AMECASPLE_015090 [Ameca splendens]|uniref:Uncharacterized protein n=1 Tax=Ameca splendens TaxID=208324 RepID=A0ABV0YCU9_9TELE
MGLRGIPSGVHLLWRGVASFSACCGQRKCLIASTKVSPIMPVHTLQEAMLNEHRSVDFFTGFDMLGPMGHQPLCSRASPATPSVELAPVEAGLVCSGFYGYRMVFLQSSMLWVWSGEPGMDLPSVGHSSPFFGVF